MVNTIASSDELIVTGFDNSQTAFLARAALARLQQEMGVATEDVAMVLRGVDGRIAVQQMLHRDPGRNESLTFWDTLAGLFFTPKSPTATAAKIASEECAIVGVNPTIVGRTVKQFRLCESALLVLTNGVKQREKVVSVMQGFCGELTRVPLEPKGMKPTK